MKVNALIDTLFSIRRYFASFFEIYSKQTPAKRADFYFSYRKLYFLLDNKPINATTAYQEIGISGSAVYSPFFLCMFNFYFNLAKHRNEKNLMIADVMSEQEKDAI